MHEQMKVLFIIKMCSVHSFDPILHIFFFMLSSPTSTVADNDSFYGWACPGKGQPLEWRQLPLKTFQDDDVEIKITHCGICATDLHVMNSDWGPTDYPCVLGHEIAGIVTKVGADISRLKVGDRVGIGAHCDSCHQCKECKNDQENLCRNGTTRTYTGHWSNGDKIYGGFGTKWRGKEHFVFKIPDNISNELAASYFCGGIATYAPLKKYGVTKGSRVGVIGLGGLGHFAVQWAKAMGAEVVVFSSSDKKREDAKALGADDYIVSSATTAFQENNCTLSHIIMCTSFGIEFDWSPYLSLMEPNGIFILTTAPGSFLEGIPASIMLHRQITIVGAAVGSPKQIRDMLTFASEKNVKPWIQKYPMEKIEDVILNVKGGKARFRIVLEV
ncbi:chaperonin 10-like protein [Phascolomyces articulosus]|uniref:Chaperonin 10-like protein n=1 Tax=Phascolomyces articulosus TaxID=60185 RepID=A0AAD5PCD0_9FUNG|nr:chaperonin 10-like protein [Phascolomyces articulosus]